MTLSRTPLQPERLRNLRWSFPKDFSFARDRLSVPLIHTEILRVAREYPIAMAPDGEGRWMAVAYLGDIAGTANRFVDASGSWTAAYVPFWLRVYPFVRDEAGAFAVTLDPTFVGVGGTYAFDDGDALSKEASEVALQLERAETGRGQVADAATALVTGGVASHRLDGVGPEDLAFVPAGRPAEVIGPRTVDWFGRGARMVEMAVAAAFSSAFMPRAVPSALTLDPQRPATAGRLPPAAPLYVPTAAVADLDWLDMDEKVLF
ncbi:SapC family protein [Methylobacterium sp. sgz302541]|uniref:SapC family protein n=1 Tax=unclassified Methylobacterium TaxID=2615210 RepID=UPI003D34A021